MNEWDPSLDSIQPLCISTPSMPRLDEKSHWGLGWPVSCNSQTGPWHGPLWLAFTQGPSCFPVRADCTQGELSSQSWKECTNPCLQRLNSASIKSLERVVRQDPKTERELKHKPSPIVSRKVSSETFSFLFLEVKSGNPIYDTSVLCQGDTECCLTLLHTALSHVAMTTCFDNQLFLCNSAYPGK